MNALYKYLNKSLSKYIYIVMSENENYTINDLMKKIILISKNIKHLNDMIKSINDKMKPVEREQQSNEEKEKINKIFQTKSIGRPTGDYPTKQKEYCEMLNIGKIKQPKQQTLDYYKISKNDDGVYVLFE